MLSRLLTLSHIPRWVIVDTLKPQTVADHSFRVAALAREMVIELATINISVNMGVVLEMAITHDADESKTGDIPTPYKQKLKSLGFEVGDSEDTIEAVVVKVADIVEAIVYVDRYTLRAKSVKDGLKVSLHKYQIRLQEEVHIQDDQIPISWVNRIINKMIEIGESYE